MHATIENLSTKAMELPPSERGELIDILVGSLEESTSDEIQQAWKLEARKRLDEIRNGLVQPVPGEDVLAKARKLVEA